jgi:predicted molibdopterin-dependent oxidoreductase YjgC
VVFTGSNANWTSAHSHWVLPAAAWVEREGTYTSFEGRVQRFRQAIEPLGQSLAEWEIVTRVLAPLGEAPTATRAEHWFRQLASSVPAFSGLSYQLIGDAGHPLAVTAATSR